MGTAVEKAFDRVPSEPMIDSSIADESVPPQPGDEMAKEETATVPAEGDLFGSDPIEPEPEPEPAAEEPVVPAADDLFGSEPMDEPRRNRRPSPLPRNHLRRTSMICSVRAMRRLIRANLRPIRASMICSEPVMRRLIQVNPRPIRASTICSEANPTTRRR